MIGTIAEIFGSKLVYVFLVVAVMTLLKLATVNSKPANQTKHDQKPSPCKFKTRFRYCSKFPISIEPEKGIFFLDDNVLQACRHVSTIAYSSSLSVTRFLTIFLKRVHENVIHYFSIIFFGKLLLIRSLTVIYRLSPPIIDIPRLTSCGVVL